MTRLNSPAVQFCRAHMITHHANYWQVKDLLGKLQVGKISHWSIEPALCLVPCQLLVSRNATAFEVSDFICEICNILYLCRS